jgi:hypothetical protein
VAQVAAAQGAYRFEIAESYSVEGDQGDWGISRDTDGRVKTTINNILT